jgi:hypothetical protein
MEDLQEESSSGKGDPDRSKIFLGRIRYELPFPRYYEGYCKKVAEEPGYPVGTGTR